MVEGEWNVDVKNWDEVDRVQEMEGCWAGLHVEKRVSELNQPTNLKEGGRWSGLTNEESVGLEVVSQGTVCENGRIEMESQQQGAPAKRQTGGRERTEDSVHGCGCEGEHKSLVWLCWRCRPLQHRFTAFWRQQPLCCSIPFTIGGWSVGLSPLAGRMAIGANYGPLQSGCRIPTGRGETNGQGRLESPLIGKLSRRVADSRAINIFTVSF